jgi:hypothetical protein
MCCGQPASVVGSISWRGNCLACANLLLEENIVGIATKRGFAYRRQARGMLRYAQTALLTTTGEETSV